MTAVWLSAFWPNLCSCTHATTSKFDFNLFDDQRMNIKDFFYFK